MANLTSKSINELCTGQGGRTIRFHIPTYQRGYRWQKEHVITLLNDLYEFKIDCKLKKSVGEFYCLQPIVVMRREDLDSPDTSETRGSVCYEVIDGQQRLTTIYILLKVFLNDELFCITYERDGDGHERERFLESIDTNSAPPNKADYHYINEVRTSAKEWIEDKKREDGTNPRQSMLSTLLDEVRVIWYELDESSNTREVFRHINDGKIQLTNSELIKAMMLNEKHYKISGVNEDVQNRITRNRQERIAKVWDDISCTLQGEAFWSFICRNTEHYSTRIDYIFKLIYLRERSEKKADSASFFTHFEKNLTDQDSIDKVWKEVRDTYRTLQDWYNDVPLYNYIGYWVRYQKKGMIHMIERWPNLSREEFRKELQNEIKDTIEIGKEYLEMLSYDDNSERKNIEKLLMLFNIETNNKTNTRFKFEVRGGWSLEHIFAQNSDKIMNDKREELISRITAIVESTLRRESDKDKRERLRNLKDSIDNHTAENFSELFNEAAELIGAPSTEDELNSISNLALLGKDDNSSLSNNAFYEKRKKLIEMVEQQKNIPQGTINVFLKYYSSDETNLDFWSKVDGENYLKKLKDTLKNYLNSGGAA